MRVSGTYNKDLTIGADNDIIVMDDFESSDTDTVLGGLIANNFVRVYHPVNNWDNNDTDCDNNGGPGNIQIEAAILALNHSFIVDNWYCGNDLGSSRSTARSPSGSAGPVGTSRAAAWPAATRRTTTTTTACAPRAAVLRQPHRLALEDHPPERAGPGPLSGRVSPRTADSGGHALWRPGDGAVALTLKSVTTVAPVIAVEYASVERCAHGGLSLPMSISVGAASPASASTGSR